MSGAISNHNDVAESAAVEKDRTQYTIDRTESSISIVSNEVENRNNCCAVFLCIAKWLVAVFLLSVVLCCVVASKVCLLVLGQQLKNLNQTGDNVKDKTVTETTKQSLFLMLLLALMIPQAVSFIHASWTSLRRKSRPWPSKPGFILIFFGGFLEAASLCYITLVMLTVVSVSADAIILFMCSLPVTSAILQARKSITRWSTDKLDVMKFGVCAVLAMLGSGLLCYKIPNISEKIGIPVAFGLLSIAWSPQMRKLQIRSREQIFNQNHGNATIRTARGKAAIVSSLWKLFLTPLFAVMFSMTYKIVELDNISAGFKAINVSNPSFVYFMLHIFTSLFGYYFGWLACALCMQQIGYALPLTLATPIAIIMTHVTGICETNTIPLPCRSEDQIYTLAAGLFLWLAQFLATTYYVWKSRGLTMAKAHDLLWISFYNGVCLEQYLLLNRRNQASDEEHVTQQNLSRDVNVFICTTMYHEEDFEMEQLLRSIHDVDANVEKSGRHYESHVFFDGCVRAEVLNSYVLQLASLVEDTLKVQLSECTKTKTPYGMQLKWTLSGGMNFTIHLKDNAKVKNKKRWSQVMYMSYVLDYREPHLGVQDKQSFILTTDADVNFTHESVEALIDQIIEDPQIGAVCARTHPMGSGPVVWYQIFDYAIGHWFQKVANHMFGSVLCSPGCFSLYRCQAVRDVLPSYATKVNHAFEFLTKDMGEDRWMCTLMIQRGWKLTYCAAAVDSTYCPESFDEFYRQRRRWTPSTLANLVLLVKEWKLTLKKNEHISFLFIVYQTFLVCSTVIGPSTVILVIVGGMLYSGIGLNEIAIVVLISLIVVGYTSVCLFTSQNFQLKVSKLLTFVFAVIMCVVVVGIAVQISNELKERNVEPTAMPTFQPNTSATIAPKPLEHHLPAGISTLYLAGLSGIFIAAALLHPKEFTCLFHGIWYLLCLPSGYLLLTIYSLCNVTDRSWGTREGKSASEGKDWYKPFEENLKDLFNCCQCCGNREESVQSQQSAYQQAERKRGMTHSACEITEPSNQTGCKGGRPFTGTNDRNTLSSPGEESLDENKKNRGRRSGKKCRNNSSTFPTSTHQIQAEDNHNYDISTVAMNSADDIPKESSMKAKSKTSTDNLAVEKIRSNGDDYGTSPEKTVESEPTTTEIVDLTQEGDFQSIEKSEPGGLLDNEAHLLSALRNEVSYSDLNVPVEDWLTEDFKEYATKFHEQGYDTVGLLFGMTDKDLEKIGIKGRGHRQRLLREIKKIPRVDIEEGIPEDVKEWLDELGLGEYWSRFESSGYKEPSDLEDLKSMRRESLKETLNLSKQGHLNKLTLAISKLQYPDQGQMKIRHTRRELNRLPLFYLDDDNNDDGMEYRFWEGLRQKCLVPELSGFDQTSKLKEKLVELRNTTLMIFGVTNALWMITILSLVRHKDLKVLSVDVIGLAFLTIYGFIFVLQFLALLGHRFKTVVHVLARTPWKLNNKLGNNRVSPSEPKND